MTPFKKIYVDYRHRVYFFVRKYIQREEDVEDIVQDIFIHVWKYTNKHKDTSILEAVIFKTSKQEIANFYRKNKITFVEQCQLPDNASDICEDLTHDDQLTKISHLLDKLPKKTRDLFIQNKIENKSYSMLAKENNISKVAIGKHVNKAIRFLKINLY